MGDVPVAEDKDRLPPLPRRVGDEDPEPIAAGRSGEAVVAEMLERAAEKGVPVAQNRLARCYANGRGVTADPVQAAKWHLLAKSAGLDDAQLEQMVKKLASSQRIAAEKAVAEWLDKHQVR